MFYVIEKLFPSQEFINLKYKLYSSTNKTQFQFVLGRFPEDEKNSKKIKWLRNKVLNTVFFSSLSDLSLKIFTSLKILDLKLTKPIEFYEIFFVKEVQKEGDWRKLLPDFIQ